MVDFIGDDTLIERTEVFYEPNAKQEYFNLEDTLVFVQIMEELDWS